MIHTIGPVWDGNEVWLLTAGGATFAAFPSWYATTFSGFYLALFLVLAALIVRGVSFEFWGKVASERWRTTWEWALCISSGAAALLFGVAWANFVHGVPMGPDHVIHASLFDLLHPYALLGGLVTLTLFLTHGAIFLRLRTKGELADRATHRRAPRRTGRRRADGRLPALDRDRTSPGGAVVVVLRDPAPRVAVVAGRRGRCSATATAGVRRRRRRRSRCCSWACSPTLFPNALPSTHQPCCSTCTLSAASSTSLHADRHDGRGGNLRADRARLHGMDVLGLPSPPRPR